mmetsp:Transcript_26373/g.59947  ORF Transcript_26373/g.59947 Transcript_26373/m.59947 type:complete len:552 (-) Transcript_26373:370-2025(-)
MQAAYIRDPSSLPPSSVLLLPQLPFSLQPQVPTLFPTADISGAMLAFGMMSSTCNSPAIFNASPTFPLTSCAGPNHFGGVVQQTAAVQPSTCTATEHNFLGNNTAIPDSAVHHRRPSPTLIVSDLQSTESSSPLHTCQIISDPSHRPPPLEGPATVNASAEAGTRKSLSDVSSAVWGTFDEEWCVGKIFPILPGRLSFTVHEDDEQTKREIKDKPKLFFFSSEAQESYEPFCHDFGPVNLAALYHFCMLVDEKMTEPRLKQRHLVYYCENDSSSITNAAFLLSAYVMLRRGLSPEDSYAPFKRIRASPLKPFRDASHFPSEYDLSILDCLRGLLRAAKLGWFSLDTFDVEDYVRWNHPSFDFHVVCPKLIAFRGPDVRRKFKEDPTAFGPTKCIGAFKSKGVSAIIRLNEPETYDATEVEKMGIRHYDLQFEDCTAPPRAIVEKFLRICKEEEGSVAVHCRAGLGRTGTLIAVYIMAAYRFSANEAIAWLRLVRPGSVIGRQQHFLKSLERGIFPQKEPVEVELARRKESKRMAEQLSHAMFSRFKRCKSS